MPQAYEFLEHTADVRLKVTGTSFEELLIHAATGLSAFIFRDSEITSPAHAYSVQANGSDRESLLVDWLNQVLVVVLTHGAVTHIEPTRISETAFSAIVWCAAATAQADVKAATYHQLSVSTRPLKDGRILWETTVTLDI